VLFKGFGMFINKKNGNGKIQVNNKRFLMIASYPDSLIYFRLELLKKCVELGLEVHVASPNISSESKIRYALEEIGVVVHEVYLDRVGMNPVYDIKSIWSIWAVMKKVKPFYVFSYTIKPVIYGSGVAFFLKVPKIYALISGVGYTFQGTGFRRTLLRKLVEKMYKLSLVSTKKVFFQNPDDRDLFINKSFVQGLKKTVVVNGSGVDLVKFKISPITNSIKFLMIARLLEDKGIREYAKAAEIVKLHHPEATFKLIGWMDKGPNAIKNQELQDWINRGVLEFEDWVDDVRPAINECAVFVLPSYREGTPRSVLEAMAMGRPIVTTDAPGCRETVINNLNGYLVPVKSVEELSSSLLLLCGQKRLIQKMGRASRKIAENKYNVHRVNEHILGEMEIKL
jgi:glycosyltransferase involved in cell wall biosynthesis